MSENCFGTTRFFINKTVAGKLDKICQEEGGYGFVGPIKIPGNHLHGWFTGPNRGSPFDNNLSHRVLERVKNEFPKVFAAAWPNW